MYIVHLRNGQTITEEQMNWKQIKEISNNFQDITSLQLKSNGKLFTVSVDGKNVDLIQVKRNTVDMISGKDTLVERVIGFVIDNKYAVKMEVGELTGNVRLTCIVKDGNKWRKL